MSNTDAIIKQLEEKLSGLNLSPGLEHVGRVEEVRDDIVIASGLSDAAISELVEFENGPKGLILNLDEERCSILIFESAEKVRSGQKITLLRQTLAINVSEDFLSRVVNPLGMPIDGKPKPKGARKMPLEKIAPGVVTRKSVDTPLKTGIKTIDAMIPIGRGQRELIIGDRALGKTAIAVDTIINQGKNAGKKRKKVICVYVAIGQKQANTASIVAKLKETGASLYTVVVLASASDSAALQYLAPYAGCAIGEYFMEKGEDVLIVFDDLTKHAWAYRQISLILKRPSGREAYPGDIFYLHSRLLERAARLNEKNGGGSLTALPIIETQAADLTTYIPTNVISITDGQIYLEQDLFNAGIRPAINLGLSVSRVGGAAQTKLMKHVAGPLRLDLAQYRELAAFAQFGADLDKATQDKLARGARITEMLKQPQYQPVTESSQVLMLWAVTNGYLDDIPVERCQDFANAYILYMIRDQNKIIDILEQETPLDEKITKQLKEATEKFKKRNVF